MLKPLVAIFAVAGMIATLAAASDTNESGAALSVQATAGLSADASPRRGTRAGGAESIQGEAMRGSSNLPRRGTRTHAESIERAPRLSSADNWSRRGTRGPRAGRSSLGYQSASRVWPVETIR
jgi:cytochrome c5